jgi:hypothetical protein
VECESQRRARGSRAKNQPPSSIICPWVSRRVTNAPYKAVQGGKSSSFTDIQCENLFEPGVEQIWRWAYRKVCR